MTAVEFNLQNFVIGFIMFSAIALTAIKYLPRNAGGRRR